MISKCWILLPMPLLKDNYNVIGWKKTVKKNSMKFKYNTHCNTKFCNNIVYLFFQWIQNHFFSLFPFPLLLFPSLWQLAINSLSCLCPISNFFLHCLYMPAGYFPLKTCSIHLPFCKFCESSVFFLAVFFSPPSFPILFFFYF